MLDLAKNFAFSICIVAGLATMVWCAAWAMARAIDEWLKWRNLRREFIAWVRARKEAERAARQQAARDALLAQAQVMGRTEDGNDVD